MSWRGRSASWFAGYSGGVSYILPSYTTTFPLTENPISESGLWTNGGIFNNGQASAKTNVQTGSGNAYGTMTNFDGTNYTDSCAHLSGFGANHSVQCTLSNTGAISGLETELLLRASITPTTVNLYEIDCVYSILGIHLVRWDMSSGNPNSFTVLRNAVTNEVAFNDGDAVFAQIVGTVVTVKYKPNGGSFSTLFTYDTAGDSIRYATGNPGIGFWNLTGSSANSPKMAWSDLIANTL